MRETEMREALRELCDELDARSRIVRGARAAALGSALGIAALALSACVEIGPQPTAADAGVEMSLKDARPDVPIAVAMYSAPGCSFVSPAWGPPGFTPAE